MNATDTSDREIRATRVFDAPRELVWKAWTDPKHVEKWWGPTGFTVTTHEIEVQPGGYWRFVMHGPDGRDYQNRIKFLEIVPPKRLVYKHEPEKGTEPGNFQSTVTFEEMGDKTQVTVHMLFPSAAQREYIAKTYGAVEGLEQHLGRLGEYLAGMKSPARQQI